MRRSRHATPLTTSVSVWAIRLPSLHRGATRGLIRVAQRLIALAETEPHS